MSKINQSLFETQRQGLQQAFGACPDCEAPLQLRHGKSGAFVGCSQYPQCEFSKPLHEHEESQIKVIDGSTCPECTAPLAIKKGRYGLFIGCTNFPECHHIESTKEQSETTFACPACQQGQLVKRSNRFGKSFYACDAYPKCKFVVNQTPLSGECQKCHFKLLMAKGSGESKKLMCADKKCAHAQSKD